MSNISELLLHDGKHYIYTLKDGYDEGDEVMVGDRKFEVLEIDQVNGLMLIREVDEEMRLYDTQMSVANKVMKEEGLRDILQGS